MHPLFTSHIIADFLLQPTWLVRWKEKTAAGIIVHALIHAAIMALFIRPQTLQVLLIIAGIAVLHGIIDSLKINYQKKHPEFGTSFLADQLMHFAVLVLALPYLPYPVFWHSEKGIGIGILLFFFSFIIALFNLADTYKTAYAKGILFAALAFMLFFVPALLFASSLCSLL